GTHRSLRRILSEACRSVGSCIIAASLVASCSGSDGQVGTPCGEAGCPASTGGNTQTSTGNGAHDGGTSSPESDGAPSHDDAGSDDATASDTTPDAYSPDGSGQEGSASDDPCPSTTAGAAHVINCSSSCGWKPTPCPQRDCPSSGYVVTSLPLLVRTPDLPAVTEACAACGGPAFELVFSVLGASAVSGVRVTVGEPWHIVDNSTCYSGCLALVQAATVKVATTDPSAPARNIVFERFDPAQGGTGC